MELLLQQAWLHWFTQSLCFQHYPCKHKDKERDYFHMLQQKVHGILCSCIPQRMIITGREVATSNQKVVTSNTATLALAGNICPLPYLISYRGWGITDISCSSFLPVQSPPHVCTGSTNLPPAGLRERLSAVFFDCCSGWAAICFSGNILQEHEEICSFRDQGTESHAAQAKYSIPVNEN